MHNSKIAGTLESYLFDVSLCIDLKRLVIYN